MSTAAQAAVKTLSEGHPSLYEPYKPYELYKLINPFSMKRSKVFEQILNGLVLLGSLAIIIVASIELLDGNNALSEAFILKFHLWVCGLFLADFFVRWYTDGWTGRFQP